MVTEQSLPFPLQFAEEMPVHHLVSDYDESAQTLCIPANAAPTGTSLETATDGHGDTDTDTDTD